jgi:lysophospholipase L1-like esterase
MRVLPSRRSLALALAALLTGAAHLGIHQLDRQARFEIGEPSDRYYLIDPESFQAPAEMEGPLRRPGAEVETVSFTARLTRRRAGLRLPYHAVGTPVRLNLRCHRFGLGGNVALSVNGRLIANDSFESAYPWAGIQALVPAEVASLGPLTVELWTSGGSPAPSHLPDDLGVGLDWVEVSAESGGVLLPVPEAWIRLVLLLVASALALAVFRVPAAGQAPLLLAGGLGAVAIAHLGGRTDGLLYLRLGTAVALLAALSLGFRCLHRAWPGLALRLATLALASGFAFIAVEGFARFQERRLRDARPAHPESLQLLRPNPAGTGSYRLRPGLEIRTRVGFQDVVIRTNSHGMRWREVSREADPARARIAFLGDSFTFGCWAASAESSFVGVAEARLGAKRYEALNFGVGGYGVADSELLLRELAIGFSPRYVVLALFNGNDFRDTFLGIDKERIVGGAAFLDQELLEQKVPRAFLQDDRTISRPSLEGDRLAPLRRLASFRLLAPLLRLEPVQVEFAPNVRFVSASFWSRIPYHPVALEARDATLAAIGRIDAFTRARGIRLGVVAIPTRDQVHARRGFGADYDIGLPQAWVQTWCREARIPYLDLLPSLRETVVKTNQRLYVPGDTHLDGEGHRLVGEAIGDWIDCCVANQE